jgi:hypothetical protein
MLTNLKLTPSLCASRRDASGRALSERLKRIQGGAKNSALASEPAASCRPPFSAPARSPRSCPSAARRWLAARPRPLQCGPARTQPHPARLAWSCWSHPHSGRETEPAGPQIARAADERCSLDCCACGQFSAPARRRLFRPAVSRPALAARTRLAGLAEKPRSLPAPAERACRHRPDHDSARRREPDGPFSAAASLPQTGAANCSFAEPAPARVNDALAARSSARASRPRLRRPVSRQWLAAPVRSSGSMATSLPQVSLGCRRSIRSHIAPPSGPSCRERVPALRGSLETKSWRDDAPFRHAAQRWRPKAAHLCTEVVALHQRHSRLGDIDNGRSREQRSQRSD